MPWDRPLALGDLLSQARVKKSIGRALQVCAQAGCEEPAFTIDFTIYRWVGERAAGGRGSDGGGGESGDWG